MFKKITNICVRLVQRYLPDPFLFCIILTVIVFAGGVVMTKQTPMAVLIHWNDGFWSLLAFSMQMALVLVTGHTLANAPIIQKGLKALAYPADTAGKAIVAVTIVSAIACWINWGFGLVVGALYARELAKKVKDVDYRLLIASAYTGFLVWHSGISGSIPLKVATAGPDLAAATKGAIVDPISTTDTIFSAFNLIIVLLIFITMPIVNRLMHPVKEETISIDPELLEDETPGIDPGMKHKTPADWMENTPLFSMIIGIMGLGFIVYYFAENGFKLNLNIVNFIFLFAGILLHGTPRRFLNALSVAVKGAGGIILQFPFYAGIMGMMVGANAAGVSTAGLLSHWFVAISNTVTFPFFTFLSAGIVNFFVPSGGGQWAVQAPIMMPAGAELGVPMAKTAMAIAWGDAWTNMIQPFWALPALGIAGLGARDIMGFCLIVMIYTGVIISLGLMFL